MSLRLLVDEDTQARRSVEILRAESYDVLTISEANKAGVPDTIVMEFARNQLLVLLTRSGKRSRVRDMALKKENFL